MNFETSSDANNYSSGTQFGKQLRSQRWIPAGPEQVMVQLRQLGFLSRLGTYASMPIALSPTHLRRIDAQNIFGALKQKEPAEVDRLAKLADVMACIVVSPDWILIAPQARSPIAPERCSPVAL